MIIAINEELIDTNWIFRISQIYTITPSHNEISLCFDIIQYGNLTKTIKLFFKYDIIKSYSYNLPFDKGGGSELVMEVTTRFNDNVKHYIVKNNIKNIPLYNELHEKLNNIRNEVIKYWKPEQLEIPKIII